MSEEPTPATPGDGPWLIEAVENENTRLREQLRGATQLIAALVEMQGGKVTIPNRYLQDGGSWALTSTVCGLEVVLLAHFASTESAPGGADTVSARQKDSGEGSREDSE